MQIFTLHTELCVGPNACARLNSLGAKRVFLVADPFFVKNGWAQRIAAECHGSQCSIFDAVEPDPSLACIAKGVADMTAFVPDAVIALGGGSAIDCAKGILSMSTRVPFVAIPTTSGTGSEVTSFAVLTHNGVKHPLVDPTLRPDIAILDDALLEHLPPSLIADAGMDVLAHCAEAVASKNAGGFSTALASGAFRTGLELLPKSFGGDASVRGAIHEAAAMAGAAFDQAGLGACHALSHAIGGAFHIPHGRLNAILLPHVIAFNAQTHPKPYETLAAMCGLHGVGGLLAALSRLRRQLKLPSALTQAGISRSGLQEQAADLAEAAVKDPCAATNPRPLTQQDAQKLLLEAL